MSADKRSEIRSNRKSVWLGTLAGWIMRLLGMTLRLEIRNDSGVDPARGSHPPIIFVMWHSRIFTGPSGWKAVFGGRRRCVALTSASHDGDIVANAMAVFGIEAVRGSSSRRGVAALVGLKRALREGCDICLTPDGPRGPRYRVQAGAVKLAESTGAVMVPIHVRFGSAWRLKSWDRLVIPRPFSRVWVTFGPPMAVGRGLDEPAFEAERQKVELVLVDGADDA